MCELFEGVEQVQCVQEDVVIECDQLFECCMVGKCVYCEWCKVVWLQLLQYLCIECEVVCVCGGGCGVDVGDFLVEIIYIEQYGIDVYCIDEYLCDEFELDVLYVEQVVEYYVVCECEWGVLDLCVVVFECCCVDGFVVVECGQCE